MLELQQIEANTSNKKKEPGILSGYTVLKILLNRDYLVKDKFQEKYLLCHSTKRYDFKVFDIGQSHMVKSIQFIKDENSYYEVFPMSKKLAWAGDTAQVRNKSQIYALALLYSSIRYIIKPLLALPTAHHLAKFICIDNLWFKGTSSYLFLCNRHIDKNIQKTENHSIRKYLPATNLNHQKTQTIALSKIGQVFWNVFFSEKQLSDKNQSKKTFKEIIKLMLKGEVKLIELQSIMEDKITKKRFVSSLNSRKYTIDQRDLKQFTTGEYQTIQQSIFSKLENIPISAGKPYPGLLFQKKGAQHHPFYQKNVRASLSIDQQDNIYPPSFYKVKRPKRLSLFSGTKNTQCNRYDETSRQQQNNALSINRKICDKSAGQSLDTNRIGNSRTISIQNHQKYKTNKQKKQLRKFFDQNLKNLQLKRKNSKIQGLEGRSRDKALQKFKKSIEVDKINDNNLINDSHFISNLRYKRHQNKKIVQISLIKAQEYFNNYYLPLNHPKDSQRNAINNYLENSRIQEIIQKQQTSIKQKFQEKKIHNEDLLVGNQRVNTSKIEINEPYQFQINNNTGKNNSFYTVNKKDEKQFLRINEANRQAKLVQKEMKQANHSFTKIINEQSLAKSKLVQQQSILSNNFSFNEGPKKKDPDQNISLSYSREESKIEFYNLPPKIRANDPSTLIEKEEKRINSVPKQQTFKDNFKNTNKQQPLMSQKKLKIQEQLPEMKKEKNIKQQISNKQKQQGQKLNLFSQESINLKQIEQPKTYDVKQKKIIQKRQQMKEKEKEIEKNDKMIKKQKNTKKGYQLQLNDEIQQIQLVSKKDLNQSVSVSKIDNNRTPKQIVQPIKSQINKPLVKSEQNKKQIQKKQPKQLQNKKKIEQNKEKQQIKQVKKQRLKTGQSNASSNGGKSVKKQIDEYIYMINKMGQAVAKTSKLSKKLQKIQWFTGVYFLYKRFFYERKKIQKYLTDQEPKLTRYEPFSSQDWKQWLSKGEKEAILNKCREDNINIQKSIKKMSKKIQSMQLPASVLLNININKNMEDSSRIAVEYIVDEYDQIVEQNLLQDGEILIHICQMINSLFVMAEIDGKVKEKRPVLQFGNIKRSKEELSQLAQKIFDLYQDM